MLLAEPRVLLLDEPFASLDLPGQMRLAADIAACPQQVIVSTHVLEHVSDWPRVLWLERGRVRADGPGAETCAAYEASVREGAKALQGGMN
jgi:biotin transport system ATP-binding protein